ncbi:MAG: hypothetical protein JWN39_4433 [Ilumatobacteraceae bacterium]|nr:hypothetical protein [Ilumatobacteraceae bacterium]
MPRKWKLTGGASAQQRADRLRSRSDKLARQATVWESGAALEPSIRRKLDELPPGFTVLHDLVIDAEGTRLDHLVIGNGGLYLVDAKRYSGHLVYSKKMLWHGRFPIVDKLETLVWEAESLGNLLGQDVVPVMCFVDAVLPQPVTTLGSVIVCRVSVLHTIVRSTHATMSTVEVQRILEIAGSLAVARSGSPDTGEVQVGWVSPHELDQNWAPSPDDDRAYDDATGQTAVVSTIPSIPGPEQFTRPLREPKARRWPRRLAFAVMAVAGVAAAVFIVWSVSSKTAKTAREIAANPPTTTAAPTTTTTEPDTVAASTSTTSVGATSLGFSVSCPVPGAGWVIRPVWPGDLPGLAWYDFAYQGFDLTYTQFALMTAPDATNYTPLNVPASNSRTIRIRPVYTNGVVGEETTETWTAPADPC